jgi:general secretion pathway protein L
VNVPGQWSARLSRWLEDVASASLAIEELLRPSRSVEIVEQPDGGFLVRTTARRRASRTLGPPLHLVDGRIAGDFGAPVRARLAGGRLEVLLAEQRFLFPTLELPRQAAGFLDGVVRAQIDRLTPWTPAQAAFGCSAPTEAPGGRVGVTVAATARSALRPLVAAFETLKPDSIAIAATRAGADGKPLTPIVVFRQQANRQRRMRRLRRILVGALALSSIGVVAALVATLFVGADLEASRQRVARQIAERRVALLSGRSGVAEEATAALAQKKRETPATVIVLEQLSRALPDDTYLTELHVADGKLQITGVTREAASLIRIIEQTEQFRRATFFAPTTRAPLENGEQFHIEAQVEPWFPEVR